MSVDREYRIRIATVADNTGTQQIGRELDSLSPKTKKYVESLKEGGGEAEKMEISHRNLRFGLRMLGPEFAEVGHLGVASFANPLTAGFLAVAVMAGKLYNDWARTREAIEKAPDLSGIDKVSAALGREGMLKALNDGTVAADEFWGKLERLATAQETLKDKTDDATAALKAQTEADNKALSAKEKAELAELKLAKAKGELTEEQYNQKKAAIEDRFEGERGNNKAIEQDQVIADRKKEREGQAAIVRDAPDVLLPKQLAADEAKGKLDGQKTQLEEWKKKLEEVNKWFKEEGSKALGSKEGAQKYAEMEKTQRLALGEVTNREANLPGAESKSKAAAAELAESERKVEEARKRMTELDREIPKQEATRTRDTALRGEEAGANKRRRAAEGEEATWEKIMKSPEAKSLKEGADLEAIKESGGKLTVQQQSQLASINSLLESYNMNGQASLHALAALHGHGQALGAKIQAMAKQIDALTKQLRNQASPP